MIAVNVPTAAHFVLDQMKRAANTAIPSNIGDNRWPVVATRVPSPKLAASAKQATRRIRDGIVGSTLSVFVRILAPRVANSKSGCFMAKPMINGAMTKAAALSPVVRLNADLSRLQRSLRNQLMHDILYL
jgi:hypothetical protein